MVKYYAIRRGRKTGIFTNWPVVKNLVQNYSRSAFKSFSTWSAAEHYLNRPTAGLDGHLTVSHHVIIVYTDGGSRNTGTQRHHHVKKNDKSAWAFLICLPGRYYPETGGKWGATNNQMEITALLQALRWLLKHHDESLSILEVADSRYVLNVITRGWLSYWRCHDWRLKSGRHVKNRQLWQTMAKLLARFNNLQFKWTKGHAKNNGNNFVDCLLNHTMDRMHNRRLTRRRSPRLRLTDREKSVRNIQADLKRLGLAKF